MDRPEGSLPGSDPFRQRAQALRVDRAGGEACVQFAFEAQKLRAQRLRLRAHPRHDRFQRLALLARELERFGELEPVHRSGKAVEFGRLRQTHASPMRQIVDLPGRQRLNLPLLLVRIGTGRLRHRHAVQRDGSRDQDECGWT